MTFDEFQRSHMAQSALKRVWRVLQAAASHYPDEPWRKQSPQHHATRAHMHFMRAFENIDSVEDGKGANTGLPDLDHGGTRFFMLAALLTPEVSAEVPVVDCREEE